MIKAIKIFTTVAAITLLSSFTMPSTNDFLGTYSVPDSDPAQIQLTLNADHTFYYQDFSVSTNKIAVTGNWTQKGNKVMLEESESGMQFHNDWTFVENGQVAKSRKGLSFYRLCKIEG